MVEPPIWKNILVKLNDFPNFRGEHSKKCLKPSPGCSMIPYIHLKPDGIPSVYKWLAFSIGSQLMTTVLIQQKKTQQLQPPNLRLFQPHRLWCRDYRCSEPSTLPAVLFIFWLVQCSARVGKVLTTATSSELVFNLILKKEILPAASFFCICLSSTQQKHLNKKQWSCLLQFSWV